MATTFTIIQCVPDPITDERLNIGVVVYGDGRIRSRFIKDWRPVSSFAREDISYLKDFAQRFSQATQEEASVSRQVALIENAQSPQLTEQKLATMISDWSNSIQFSPPQLSLEHPDALLEQLAATHLRAPSRHRRFRDRKDAVHLAVSSAREAIKRRLGPVIANELVISPYEMSGRLLPRLKLDMAVKNGRVYVATQALSFETPNLPKLDDQIQKTVHVLKDIGDAHPKLRLGTVVLPPMPNMDDFQETFRRFTEFRSLASRASIRVIDEAETPDWAEEIADLVETEIAPQLRRALFT